MLTINYNFRPREGFSYFSSAELVIEDDFYELYFRPREGFSYFSLHGQNGKKLLTRIFVPVRGSLISHPVSGIPDNWGIPEWICGAKFFAWYIFFPE